MEKSVDTEIRNQSAADEAEEKELLSRLTFRCLECGEYLILPDGQDWLRCTGCGCMYGREELILDAIAKKTDNATSRKTMELEEVFLPAVVKKFEKALQSSLKPFAMTIQVRAVDLLRRWFDLQFRLMAYRQAWYEAECEMRSAGFYDREDFTIDRLVKKEQADIETQLQLLLGVYGPERQSFESSDVSRRDLLRILDVYARLLNEIRTEYFLNGAALIAQRNTEIEKIFRRVLRGMHDERNS